MVEETTDAVELTADFLDCSGGADAPPRRDVADVNVVCILPGGCDGTTVERGDLVTLPAGTRPPVVLPLAAMTLIVVNNRQVRFHVMIRFLYDVNAKRNCVVIEDEDSKSNPHTFRKFHDGCIDADREAIKNPSAVSHNNKGGREYQIKMVADGFPRGVESCSCSGTNLEHTLGNVHRTRAAVFHSTRFIKNTFCAKVFHSTTTSSTIFFFCSKVKRELANSPAENTFYPSASERELAAATSSSCLNGTLFSWPDPRKQLLVGNTARS